EVENRKFADGRKRALGSLARQCGSLLSRSKFPKNPGQRFGKSRRLGLMPLNYVVRSQVIDPDAPSPLMLPAVDGYQFLDKAKFPASFAAHVDAQKAVFMADSQVLWRAPAR